MTSYVTSLRSLELSGSQIPQGSGSTRLEICNGGAPTTREQSRHLWGGGITTVVDHSRGHLVSKGLSQRL